MMELSPAIIIDGVGYWTEADMVSYFDYGCLLGSIQGVVVIGIVFGIVILILTSALVYLHFRIDSMLHEIKGDDME